MPRLAPRFVVSFVLIGFAAPFVVLLFYSLPATEDFCKATLSFMAVPQPDILSLTRMYYTQWSARWLTTFLQSFLMSHLDLVHMYGWLLLSVIVTNLAALWYFFHTFFGLPRTNSFLAAGIFYAAYLASVTNPVAALYWLTGAIEYNLSFSTLLVLLSILYRGGRSAWYYVIVVLLSLAVPAQHEIAGTLLCAVVVSGVVVMRVKRLPARQWYLSLGTALLSLGFVIFSPGNVRRAAAHHTQLWDLAHLPKWVAHSVYHGLGWLSSASILVSACCILLLSQDSSEPEETNNLPPRWLAKAGLGAMFLVLCDVSLVEIATAAFIPDRVANWFEFVFWLSFVCAIFGVAEIRRVRFSPGKRTGAFILLAATLLASWSFRAAVKDLRGPMQSWWRIDSARLKQHGGALEFETPAPYSKYPKFAVPQSLAADPSCYVNKCLATYLHANSVVVRDSIEECPK